MPPKREFESSGASNYPKPKRQRVELSREIKVQQHGKLPASIDVEKFAEARSFEIQAIETALKSAKVNSSHRVWQTLPRHLRRRAASHDVRRVPARLRDRARAEMDSPKKKTSVQKPSCRGKTKQVSRSDSFARRQKDKTWLETHVWHAKRMHMQNLWGYRLAVNSTDKSFRPSHRAAVHGTILHDASYISTIEITGSLDHLNLLLLLCCDPQTASPGAIRYSSGSRICETYLYNLESFPHGLIAPIEVIWKPVTEEEKQSEESTPVNEKPKTRRLWVRIHPAAFDIAKQTLQQAASKVLAGHSSYSTSECTIQITDLRTQINTFELCGPQSSRVIWQVLSIIRKEKRKDAKQFWNALPDLDTPASLPRGMVVGLTVVDPRLRSKRREVPKHSELIAMPYPSASLATSDIWSEKKRLSLAVPRYKTKDLNDRRHKQDIPGTQLEIKKQDDRIPLLLIQRTLAPLSSSQSGSSSTHASLALDGWTLMFPRGWGMAFLNTFTQAGIRVGGLRDRAHQAVESCAAFFPHDYPATFACNALIHSKAEEERQAWERKPPAKRSNWDALGTRSPWKPDWDVVLGIRSIDMDLLATERDEADEENDVENTIWQFRGAKSYATLEGMMGALSPATSLVDWVNNVRAQRGMKRLPIRPQALLNSGLVTVQINVDSRGAPEPHSHIYYLPDAEVYEWLKARERDTLECEVDSESIELAKRAPSQALIIGYVTSGGYSLSRGGGFAIGHVSLARMLDICRQSKRLDLPRHTQNLVKVRNRDSDMCRLASLRSL